MASQHVEAAYITRPVSIAYLTGFRSEPMERLMALAIRPAGATLIVPALEKDHAVGAVSDVGVVAWSDGEDPYVLVREALTGADRAAVEKDHLTVRQAELLQLRHMSDISGEVRRMRSVKTAGELEKLHRAASITDRAYEEVVQDLEQSKTELQEKILDLEKFEEVVVGRELKMIALEKELESLQRENEKLKAARASA